MRTRRATRMDRSMAVAVALAAVGVLAVAAALPIFLAGTGWAFDFTTYFDAASRIRDGLSPYLSVNLAGPFTQGPQWYVYAPVLSALVVPLTGLSLHAASLLWAAATTAFTALACALLPAQPWVRLATFGVTLLSVAFLSDLNLGSVNALLLCCLVLAWRRPVGLSSGLAMALSLSIRPYLGTVVVGWALWRRWPAIVWTALGGLVLLLGTILVAGPGAFVDFLRLLANVRFAGAPHNGALVGVLDAAGVSGPWLLVGTVIAIAIGLGAVLLARLRGDPDITFAVAVGASIVASPVIWDHYLMLLAIPAALLAQRGRSWGLALPLLSWLPWQLYPVVALVGAFAPFAARAKTVGQALPSSRPDPVGEGVSAGS